MDDFAGLVWGDTTIKPKSQPQTLGSGLSQPSRVNVSKPYDAFAAIASSGPSRPLPSRSNSSFPSQSGRYTPASHPPIAVSNSHEAFSGLLSIETTSHADRTIAERQAQAERERTEKNARPGEELWSQNGFWDRYDSIGARGPKSSAATGESSSLMGLSSSLLSPTILTPSPRPSSAAPSSKSQTSLPPNGTDPGDSWKDFDLLSLTDTTTSIHAPKPAPSIPYQTSMAQELFDFSALDGQPKPTSSRASRPQSRSRTPGDFDFGDGNSGALIDEDDRDGEEDLLSGFGRPVRSRPQPASNSQIPQQWEESSHPKNTSPPPHIVGQIVEMGFAPQEARAALASTASGVDVQAALETLLNGSRDTPRSPRPRRPASAEDETAGYEWRERGRERRHHTGAGGSDDSSPSREIELKQQIGGSGLNAAQLKEQADKYLAQASEIGLSMFTKANALLSQGRAQLQKAYEDRRGASETNISGSRLRTGERLSWAADPSATVLPEPVDVQSRFRDNYDDGNEGAEETSLQNSLQPLKRPQFTRSDSPVAPPPQADLFSKEPTTTYVSPHRRRRNRVATISDPVSEGKKQDQSARASPIPASRPISPPRLRKRAFVSASQSVLATAKSYRSKGTGLFRLGRFAEAEASYTSAIASIPSGHLYLLPLHNNRAATRLKTGDSKGAIADCTTVLQIIGEDFHPAKDEPAPPFTDGETLNLGDAYVKALYKRAEAYEGGEKWIQAKHDWEKLVTIDWPPGQRVRREALRGAARCRKMLSTEYGADGEGSTSFAKPVTTRRPQPPKPATSSEASNRLRAANQAAEAEELERARLKDAVDGKLGAWKNGKENNLRALIASLDTVLWSELGWQKVGMHELVTPAQVKVRYMKAISRLHPDKASYWIGFTPDFC
ncbi:uncharacterized protein EI90DRAFT_3129764 [Cantharellus anzutake]|uniref:uncharacterized protein n=1 Tax=Cantharellus anzutake TaxID=1750568 RepID=UPI001904553F|nr:uncharacterized protein EI90DRAFT_3129764 [Cantharellus anzutake]KAF8324584.1 hypothetical protein EI90DRAFT_3129764 [Cantharellus anzutake]